MIDKDIKSYLEDRLKRLESIRNEREWTASELGDIACCKQTLAFIDSMQEVPVSEELEKAAEQDVCEVVNTCSATKIPNDHIPSWVQDAMVNEFIHGAKWQKQQDKSTIELAEEHAMMAGMEKMEEEMMKDAIDVTVHIDAGGYPYIPQMELYDYDKDVPLAKKGNKYKVIFIKEE